MLHSDRAAYVMLIGMALCFGGTWVAGAVAVDAAPPFTIAAVRFGVASILLYAWARLTGRELSPLSRGDLPMVIGLGLTAVAGYNWLFLTGLTLAPASDGAIIVPGLAPVFTAVLAGLLLRERLGRARARRPGGCRHRPVSRGQPVRRNGPAAAPGRRDVRRRRRAAGACTRCWRASASRALQRRERHAVRDGARHARPLPPAILEGGAEPPGLGAARRAGGHGLPGRVRDGRRVRPAQPRRGPHRCGAGQRLRAARAGRRRPVVGGAAERDARPADADRRGGRDRRAVAHRAPRHAAQLRRGSSRRHRPAAEPTGAETSISSVVPQSAPHVTALSAGGA